VNNPFQITTTYRLDQLERRLSSLEASLSLLGQRVTGQDKAVDRLVKQREIKIGEAENLIYRYAKARIEVPRHLVENKSRKKEAVAERYAAWEKLDRAGLRPYEIAEAFQCDHGSVLFAKKQGFKSGWMLRAERTRLKS